MRKYISLQHFGYVYMMTNKNRTTLYIGVTNDLCRRIYEHKNHLNINSFTDKYNLEYCIYYEEFQSFNLAIQREKELKKWNRQKKDELINKATTFPNTPPLRKRRCHSERSEETQSNRNWSFRAKRGNYLNLKYLS